MNLYKQIVENSNDGLRHTFEIVLKYSADGFASDTDPSDIACEVVDFDEIQDCIKEIDGSYPSDYSEWDGQTLSFILEVDSLKTLDQIEDVFSTLSNFSSIKEIKEEYNE